MRIFPVSKNARFTHDMANFGFVVRGKRFSTHEAVFLIIRFPDYTYRVFPLTRVFPGTDHLTRNKRSATVSMFRSCLAKHWRRYASSIAGKQLMRRTKG